MALRGQIDHHTHRPALPARRHRHRRGHQLRRVLPQRAARVPRALRLRPGLRGPATASSSTPAAIAPATSGTSSSRGVGDGQLYGFRVDGPYAPAEAGHRFNVNKLLLDPYARGTAGEYIFSHDALYGYDRSSPLRDLSFSGLDSAPYTAKSMAMAPSLFDWEDDRPPRTPLNDSVIYEVHVKGFTIHPSSATRSARHLPRAWSSGFRTCCELGVTAVELLPVHEFAEGEPIGIDPVTGEVLSNYWGYQSLGFFAPEQSYASDRRPGGPSSSSSSMVRELHRAGIEVILDVVFNHTGEGNELGPTLCFRGLDNASYYMLDGGRRYKNFSGCGNTLNCNHPVLKQLILDSLRYWVVEMHVDGFRFDLATILGRSSDGRLDRRPQPALRHRRRPGAARLQAHRRGLGRRGHVQGRRLPDGLGRVERPLPRRRAPLRSRRRRHGAGAGPPPRRQPRSLRQQGQPGPQHQLHHLPRRLHAARPLLLRREAQPAQRREQPRRQLATTSASNCGVEGETDDPAIQRLRLRQAKNLLVILLCARGTPMLLGGDERWRTQQGNNNTYCQDNELGWLRWEAGAEAEELHRFARHLVALRRRHPAFRRPCFVDPFAGPARCCPSPGGNPRWPGWPTRARQARRWRRAATSPGTACGKGSPTGRSGRTASPCTSTARRPSTRPAPTTTISSSCSTPGPSRSSSSCPACLSR